MNYKLIFPLILPLLVSFQTLENKEYLMHKWEELLSSYKIPAKTQSFCFDNGTEIFGKNIHQRMKPASVSKLYTTYWAISKLGPDFQFPTYFYLKDKTLYIQGGGDPFFVTENFFSVMSTLNQLGIRSLEKIIIHHDFAYNWTKNQTSIIKNIRQVFNTASWDQMTKKTFQEMNQILLKNDLSPLKSLQFSVAKISFGEFHFDNPSFIHLSSPIKSHLKQVNIYSNNFYSDELFTFLGGPNAFADFILQELNETRDTILFETGSGLGDNYTTCATTLKLLSKLENLIFQYGDQLHDYISLAGMDQGTLASRFKTQGTRTVIAKTGTLRDTTALAGYLGQESHKFVILNHGYNLAAQRVLQDELILEAIRLYHPTSFHDYLVEDYVSVLASSIIVY